MSDQLPLLQRWIDEHGIRLANDAIPRLAHYLDLLLMTNRVMNLTRITDPDDAQMRILADSLDLLQAIPESATTLVDIGSGGGVPGMALAITRSDVRVTLVDATAKKVRFLHDTARMLELDNVVAIQARAEDLGRDPRHRDHYDVVTARAVARLVTLVELALPLVRTDGVAILPKGSAAEEELGEAAYAIRMLGARPRPILDGNVDGTRIIVLDKHKATPSQFPRRTGLPNASPLLGPAS